MSSYWIGCGISAGLIMAIGAQNAFVLKQGILKQHVLLTVLFCAFSDAILVGLGVGGFGQLILSIEGLLPVAKWGGAIFLAYYGFKSFRSAWRSSSLQVDMHQIAPHYREVILSLFAFTYLNPHVYLDTVVLLGSISAQFGNEERLWFGYGAVTASFLWFFALGYGARALEPLFAKPVAWKILDILIGMMKWALSLSLVWPESDCLV
ncbi:LysE/ArgO family amino acid transporter [Candidatus Bealeia paramacronuclearis]|uniref:LysE/ArgO family amino acid transporter n=1 Tax=Candidatus Bealeia paramacronuclearis TaxID=1921001 RepID=A0ABZ2C814_9PROT|nr:LysE/ArgO family amino acid transporter [Candidatus Bealeia paramacronuclearis]